MEGHTSLRPGEVAPLRGEGQEGDAHLFTNGRASRSQATRPVRGRCKSFNLTQPEFSLTAPDPTSGAAVCFSAHDGLKVARLPAMRALLPRRSSTIQIQQEGAQPIGIALRVLPALIYGPDHAYGLPILGRREALEAHRPEAMADFHRRHYRADRCCLSMAGPLQGLGLNERLQGSALAELIPASGDRKSTRLNSSHRT